MKKSRYFYKQGLRYKEVNLRCKVCSMTFINNRNSGYHYYKTCSIRCFQAAGYQLSDLEKIPEKREVAKIVRAREGKRASIAQKCNRERTGKSKDRFYQSEAWLALRYKVLKEYGSKCMLCKEEKGSMHVDHIKPRSLWPELALSFDNLQVLCRRCNLGKSNKDQTDFRDDRNKNRQQYVQSVRRQPWPAD